MIGLLVHAIVDGAHVGRMLCADARRRRVRFERRSSCAKSVRRAISMRRRRVVEPMPSIDVAHDAHDAHDAHELALRADDGHGRGLVLRHRLRRIILRVHERATTRASPAHSHDVRRSARDSRRDASARPPTLERSSTSCARVYRLGMRALSKLVRGAAAMICATSIAAACASSDAPKPENPSDVAGASSSTAATEKLDCAFLMSDKNCWRAFAATMSACLGGRLHPTGKLSADLTECSLEDDVKVKLGQPCDPDKECEPTDVFMGRGDKKCMEFHASVTKPPSEIDRGAGHFEIDTAQGTLKLEWDPSTKTLTCPDGSVHSGSGDWKKELKDCAETSGYDSMPSYAFTTTATTKDGKKKKPGSLSFELSSVDVLFECAKP